MNIHLECDTDPYPVRTSSVSLHMNCRNQTDHDVVEHDEMLSHVEAEDRCSGQGGELCAPLSSLPRSPPLLQSRLLPRD